MRRVEDMGHVHLFTRALSHNGGGSSGILNPARQPPSGGIVPPRFGISDIESQRGSPAETRCSPRRRAEAGAREHMKRQRTQALHGRFDRCLRGSVAHHATARGMTSGYTILLFSSFKQCIATICCVFRHLPSAGEFYFRGTQADMYA